MNNIGEFITRKRKELGYTQQNIAESLNISTQAVSKWESGKSLPDIQLLTSIADLLNTSVDTILGYTHLPFTHYEEKYSDEKYYWGIVPNKLCYEIMRLCPPVKPYRVLDIGCGEGKDAVFLAKNGYEVTAFDIAEAGLDKAKKLAEHHKVKVDFFKADINEYTPNTPFDIIYSSGVFHYISANRRNGFFEALKKHTTTNGINVVNVFVTKPFINDAPDLEETEKEVESWYSGDLSRYYHDWLFHKNEEIIFDCSSGDIPHKHCMDVLIAEKI